MSASVPHCGACEAALRPVEGKWVCCQPGCPLHGGEQFAAPDAFPENKPQRSGGMTR